MIPGIADPTTIDKARSKRLAELRTLISNAFAGVTLGNGVGLCETHALDDYEDQATCAASRACDEKQDWRGLPSKYLTGDRGGLAFFDAEGMRFHLPAFLLAELETGDLSMMAHYLSHLSDHVCWQLSLLSEPQRQAVRAWLHAHLEDTADPSEHLTIRRSLDGFWSEPGETESEGASEISSLENPKHP